MNRVLIGLACGAATVVAARPAHALGPVDVEVAALGGYGTNHLHTTLGGRAGVSFSNFYLGVRGAYYFGETYNLAEGTAPVSYHQLAFGVEVGYGVRIALLELRPLLGIGQTTTYGCADTQPDGTVSNTCSQAYLQPGGLVLVHVSPFFVGVGASALFFTTLASDSAFVAEGQLGLRL